MRISSLHSPAGRMHEEGHRPRGRGQPDGLSSVHGGGLLSLGVLLEARQLGKDYGPTRAVGEVSFAVDEGEIFGLLGPNGAGKTTTISMIAGVLKPTRGTAVVAGHDVIRDSFAARREIGLVPQDLALYEELSAVQNLRFFASLYGVTRSAMAERVDWALSLEGLSDRATRKVSTFSGGMKRRLNLVAGLIHRPKLVILDEPTVGVDPQSRNFLFEAIEGLAQEGMSIVYTSHYMEEVETLCKRIAIVDQGEIVAEGDVTTLLAEHATETLTIEFLGDEAKARDALASYSDVEVSEGRVSVAGDVVLSELVRSLETAHIGIKRVASSEPNLESVFLSLTGHTLRDGQ